MENYTYYQYCNYYGVFEPYGNITELEVKELIKGSTALSSGFYLLSTFKDSQLQKRRTSFIDKHL